jgi:uncharacterized repeat protein (TIGR01451 family)
MTCRTYLSLFRASTAATLIAFIPHGITLAQEDGERPVVPLATGRITLPPSVPETLPQQVGELVERRLARTGAAPATAPVIVLFEGPLDQETRERLTAAGVDILDRLDPRSYTVSISPEGADRLAELPGVVSATVFPPDSKIAPEARSAGAFEWERRQAGRRAYSVLFFEGTPAEEVVALREELNAELEAFDARSFPIVRTAIVVIDPEDLPRLAAEPSVQKIEPAPPPDEDQNLLNAQPLSNVDDVQTPPYNLNGTGITVGVWEFGNTVYAAHLDLTPRVIVQAGQTATNDDHAAHVAGTIGASGVNVANAEGMAPNATIASWDSANDAAEMTNAATSPGGAGQPTPIQISNHSYGTIVGWNGAGTTFTNNQNLFGQYNIQAQGYDNIVAQTGLIVVKSAGNDRNNAPAVPVPGQPADCFQGGLAVAADCIDPRGTAKNIITVGAMTGPAGITGFSSYGPTDDGRIKPDLMAHGFNLLSLACNCFDDRDGDGLDDVPNSTTSNRTLSGTSMSTPVVSGVAALVLQEAGRLGIGITPAAVKALLVQTAQDVQGIGQSNPGPDFATGYGIADVQAAVDLLRLPGGPGLVQDTIATAGAAGAFTRAFVVPAGQPELRMTLAWTDPAGTPLQNDLDLRLIAPNSTAVTPWRLNPAAPGTAAVRNGGDDAVNNVEQVSVLSPAAGIWQAQVTAKATSASFPQAFALAGPFSPVAPLSIAKADSPDPVAAGGQLTYTISVTNSGPDKAIDVEVADTLPVGVTVLSVTSSPPVCTDGTGTVTCEIAEIAGGATVNVSIVVKVDDLLVDNAGSLSITNTATVSSPLPDPDLSDNTVSEDTLVLPGCGGMLATIVGTPGNDSFLDTAADDVIATLAGDDSVLANLGGDDAICGGGGDDRIVSHTGNNQIHAGPGHDRVSTGPGDDVINAGPGDDRIVANEGDDTIDAESGDDNINAGSGSDSIDAGLGNDNIGAGPGDDAIQAGEGSDNIVAGAGDDGIDAGSGDDNVAAGAGNDTIDAGSGDDKVDAGSGDDLIDGGPGTDTCVNGEVVVQCE